jgi:uncharacterized DUF497 family protein
MKFGGFDWDSGNWPKRGKHGVSREEIEQVVLGEPAVMPDPHARACSDLMDSNRRSRSLF